MSCFSCSAAILRRALRIAASLNNSGADCSPLSWSKQNCRHHTNQRKALNLLLMGKFIVSSTSKAPRKPDQHLMSENGSTPQCVEVLLQSRQLAQSRYLDPGLAWCLLPSWPQSF